METLQPIRATDKNTEELAKLLTAATKRKLTYGDAAWGSEPLTAEEVPRSIQDRETYLFRDNTNTQVVGTVALTFTDEALWGDHGGNAIYVHRLAVDAAYKGLGARIIRWAENQAAVEDLQFLRLDCDARNKRLCEYYESQGFAKVGEAEARVSGYVPALYQKHVSRPD